MVTINPFWERKGGKYNFPQSLSTRTLFHLHVGKLQASINISKFHWNFIHPTFSIFQYIMRDAPPVREYNKELNTPLYQLHFQKYSQKLVSNFIKKTFYPQGIVL